MRAQLPATAAAAIGNSKSGPFTFFTPGIRLDNRIGGRR